MVLQNCHKWPTRNNLDALSDRTEGYWLPVAARMPAAQQEISRLSLWLGLHVVTVSIKLLFASIELQILYSMIYIAVRNFAGSSLWPSHKYITNAQASLTGRKLYPLTEVH